jgi:DNA-binding Lrp family transcriptional regulator
MDRIDYEITRQLLKDARISNKALAERVGLAPSTCLGRVHSLISNGTLRGFHADVDPAALGLGLEAMIAVQLARHAKKELEIFRDYVLALPEVVQLYHVAGPRDFLIHVQVRDAAHLRELVMNAFTARDEVSHIETDLIFQHKNALQLS